MPDTIAEKVRQYHRAASTVSSFSGMTSLADTAPPPFSHEEFSSLSEIPSVHGIEGTGSDRGAAYTATSPNQSSHKPPFLSQADGHITSNSSNPPHGAVSVCGRRRNMEDFVDIAPDFVPDSTNPGGALHFFGVFDGHGGHQVRICVETLSE